MSLSIVVSFPARTWLILESVFEQLIREHREWLAAASEDCETFINCVVSERLDNPCFTHSSSTFYQHSGTTAPHGRIKPGSELGKFRFSTDYFRLLQGQLFHEEYLLRGNGFDC
jgi:hypothetical protein